MTKKYFMKDAVKHPGAETRAAKKEGVSTSTYTKEHLHSKGHAGQMARLAEVFRRVRNKGR